MNFKDLFQYDNSDNYYKDIDSSEREREREAF